MVFVGVEGALLYSLVKFRARKGAVAAQIRGNTRLEIGWTLGAAVILVVLAVFTFAKLGGIRNPPNSDANGLPAGRPARRRLGLQPRPPNGKSLNIASTASSTSGATRTRSDCTNAPLDNVVLLRARWSSRRTPR